MTSEWEGAGKGEGDVDVYMFCSSAAQVKTAVQRK